MKILPYLQRIKEATQRKLGETLEVIEPAHPDLSFLSSSTQLDRTPSPFQDLEEPFTPTTTATDFSYSINSTPDTVAAKRLSSTSTSDPFSGLETSFYTPSPPSPIEPHKSSRPNDTDFKRRVIECAKYAKAIYSDTFQLENEESEVFLLTQSLLGSKESSNHFRCAVTLNHAKKEIICTISGTRIYGKWGEVFSDLIDDACLAIGKNPYKLQSIQALNKLLIDNMDCLEGYRICYTGHSLGAALADVAATDMALKLDHLNKLSAGMVSAITFENPGTRTQVKKLVSSLKAELRDIGTDWLSEVRNKVQYSAFNTRAKLATSVDMQMDRLYRIMHYKKGWFFDASLNLKTQFDEHDMGWIVKILEGLTDVILVSGGSEHIDVQY